MPLLYFYRTTGLSEEAVMLSGSIMTAIRKTGNRIHRKTSCCKSGSFDVENLQKLGKADDHHNFERLNKEYEDQFITNTITDLKQSNQQAINFSKMPTFRQIRETISGIMGKAVQHG